MSQSTRTSASLLDELK